MLNTTERAPSLGTTILAEDRPLDAPAASKYLAERGFSHAPATLAKLRCLGGGPRFLKQGARVRYRPSALEEWLKGRTREMAHTSEST